MKVFIEQTGRTHEKNVFDKETKKLLHTVPLHVTYPYPYGYILNTLAEDGDELDCYILTDQVLEAESIIECEPVGMAEWFENGQADHKILATPKGTTFEFNRREQEKITAFSEHFFDNQPEKQYVLGRFLGKAQAEELIKQSAASCNSFTD